MANATFPVSKELAAEILRKTEASGIGNKSEFMRLACEMADPIAVQEYFINKVRANAKS